LRSRVGFQVRVRSQAGVGVTDWSGSYGQVYRLKKGPCQSQGRERVEG
jgi:hypothetical protein